MPFKTEKVNYSIGGRFAFIRLGQKPIPGQDGRKLEGNFGVFYNIEALIDNPLSEATEVDVVFEASAGYSGAIFVVNGEIKRIPTVLSKEEALVYRVKLNPGEQRTLNLLTVPLSGSSYPATLVLRPTNSAAVAKSRGG
jgi:hypothetical protein